MSIRPPQQNARTAKRQFELEQIYQANKDAIKADLDDLALAMPEIAKRWGVSDRMIRRWAERLNICAAERLKKRNALRGPTGIVNKKKSPYDDKPQAHKLAGLW